VQPLTPDEYEKLGKLQPFAADIGKITDEEMRKYAVDSCNKCFGTGREGFIEGIAIVCRCVKKRILADRSVTDGPSDTQGAPELGTPEEDAESI